MRTANFRKLSTQITKQLTLDTMNQTLVEMGCALNSKVHHKYIKHETDMKKGIKKPFPELLSASAGDPQSFGQMPLTFTRQLLAMCFYPELNEDPNIDFPEDVKERAECLLQEFPGSSVGSLSDVQGLRIVRTHISQYIKKRDEGVECDPDNIFMQDCCKLTDTFLNLINDPQSKPIGVLVPVPSYPFYTTSLAKHKIRTIEYHLNEDKSWEVDIDDLKTAVSKCKRLCCSKGIIVINPGNPTGQVLTEENMKDIVTYCCNEDIVLIADEAYQLNIPSSNVKFHSFKKIKHQMGSPYSEMKLISLFSTSKGYAGECGFRGGFAELDGFHPEFIYLYRKAMELYKSPNCTGTIVTDTVVNPPKLGDPSYSLYEREVKLILTKMKQKGAMVVDRLNSIDGIRVTPLQGGLFAYASILNMPKKAIQKAQKANIDPSLLWTLELLDKKGIVLVPGSSFQQKPGTYHFRATIVPPIEHIEKVMNGIKEFHPQFLETYK